MYFWDLTSFLRIEGFFKPMKSKCQKLHVRPFASCAFFATADVDFEDCDLRRDWTTVDDDESATERPGVRTADEEG